MALDSEAEAPLDLMGAYSVEAFQKRVHADAKAVMFEFQPFLKRLKKTAFQDCMVGTPPTIFGRLAGRNTTPAAILGRTSKKPKRSRPVPSGAV
eukprot:s596_g6.t1